MNIENVLRKGLMWKSRIKWMMVGWCVGFVVGWGIPAHAQSMVCVGDNTSTLDSACTWEYRQTEEDCLAYGDPEFGGSVCTWTGSACVTRTGGGCSVSITETQCTDQNNSWPTCTWQEGEPEPEAQATSTLGIVDVVYALHGLNIGLAILTMLAVWYLLDRIFKGK